MHSTGENVQWTPVAATSTAVTRATCSARPRSQVPAMPNWGALLTRNGSRGCVRNRTKSSQVAISVADSLAASGFTDVSATLDKAEADLIAFADAPPQHWRRLWSNNTRKGTTANAATYPKPACANSSTSRRRAAQLPCSSRNRSHRSRTAKAAALGLRSRVNMPFLLPSTRMMPALVWKSAKFHICSPTTCG